MLIWNQDPGDFYTDFFNIYTEEVIVALGNLATYFAPLIENWMKNNALWTDRTGNARQSLYTEVEKMVSEVSIYLSHGQPYGIWLELANQGRYAIVQPALDYWAKRVWQSVKRVING
jgi:hypothetical protein